MLRPHHGRCYRLSVCPFVTLVHPAKAVGQNEMPFDKDTGVVSTLYGAMVPHRKVRLGSRNQTVPAKPLQRAEWLL